MAPVYKAINEKAACLIPADFGPTASSNRTSHDLQRNLPPTRNDPYKFSYFPRTVRVWNILPSDIVHAPDVEAFKHDLQNMFLDGRMYMVPCRGKLHVPSRYGSTSATGVVGPVC